MINSKYYCRVCDKVILFSSICCSLCFGKGICYAFLSCEAALCLTVGYPDYIIRTVISLDSYLSACDLVLCSNIYLREFDSLQCLVSIIEGHNTVFILNTAAFFTCKLRFLSVNHYVAFMVNCEYYLGICYLIFLIACVCRCLCFGKGICYAFLSCEAALCLTVGYPDYIIRTVISLDSYLSACDLVLSSYIYLGELDSLLCLVSVVYSDSNACIFV